MIAARRMAISTIFLDGMGVVVAVVAVVAVAAVVAVVIVVRAKLDQYHSGMMEKTDAMILSLTGTIILTQKETTNTVETSAMTDI